MNKFLLIVFFCMVYAGYLHSLPIESESNDGPSGDIPLSLEETLYHDKEFIDPNDLRYSPTKRDNGDLVIEQIHETDETFRNDYPTEGDSNINYDSQPSGGDTTKTLLSYTLLTSPAATAILNGYRQTTLLQNGTLIGGTGVSIDIKKNTGRQLTASIGALRPDQSESTIVHIAGNGKLYNATNTSIGVNAKASHVVGGSDNGKSTIAIKPNYRHKIKTNIGKLVDANDTMSNVFTVFVLAKAIQNLDRSANSKNANVTRSTGNDDLLNLIQFMNT